MATDDTTWSLSISLYHYICQNIVGYEDHVKTIRMTNNVRDNIANVENSVVITSGSYGEDLQMKGSDVDIMQVLNYIEVHEDILPGVYDEHKIYFSMSGEDTNPGYTCLSLVYTNYPNILQMCLDVRGKLFISNILFKQRFIKKYYSVIHGPCLSDKNGLMDYAYCLQNKSWVSSAKQWITRSNNGWPATEVKENVIDHGVLFVPIGVKGSSDEEIEWRLSFSVGEKLLIYSFTHTQLLCYSLLKILLKDVIDIYCKDLLCSYFLKTIIFWVSEELHSSVWTPEHLIPCFMKCFRRLIYCVNYSICPHYFIPENNLFENKVEGLKQQQLLNHLYTLHSYDWRCIFVSPQIPQLEILQIQNMYFPADTSSLKSILNSNGFQSLPMFFLRTNNYNEIRRNYFRSVYQLLRFQSTRIRHIYLFFMSFLCKSVFEFAEITSRPCNRCMYDLYTACLSYQLRNIHHGAVFGWLMLASFFYKTQQYDLALKLIAYALSKCTLEKLCKVSDLSDIDLELPSLRTLKRKGIISILKNLDFNICEVNEKYIIPTEVQIDNEYCITYLVTSDFYAYFLRFLCHFRLENTIQCWECILDLNKIWNSKLTSKRHIKYPIEALSLNCLGIALQLLGRNEMATLCFNLSIQMFPDPDFNTAFKRLSQISSTYT